MRKLIKRTTSPFDIQPDSLIISDIHLHERKEFERMDEVTGLNSRLVEGLDIFKQTIDILNSHPEIKHVFFLGDLFELKDKVPNHMLIEAEELLKKISRSRRVIFLLGNHDFNLPKYSILNLLSVEVISVAQTIWLYTEKYQDSERVQIAFIPFQREFPRFLELWKGAHNSEREQPDIVFFHQELPGVEYETGRKIKGELPQTLFNAKSLYISGHIHKTQKVGRVLYVGSPYQTKFSDEGQTRYIWLLNSKTKAYAPVKLHYPEFKSIAIETYKHKGSTLPGDVEGNYVRVVGEVPASQWDIQTRKEIKVELEKAGAKGISFQVQIVKQRQVAIPADKVDDDESIIRLYVDQNDLGSAGLDKNEVLKVGLDLFKK